ncbi:MAG: sensor histidine kinase [Desulfofundulus sp.]
MPWLEGSEVRLVATQPPLPCNGLVVPRNSVLWELAAIGEMAAGVAHELNSPMTVIIGNTQMLQRELGPEHPASQLLRDIVTCGLRCKKIIQNLLTFARQEPPVVASTDLNEVVERVLSLVKYQINRNGINVYTDRALPLWMI